MMRVKKISAMILTVIMMVSMIPAMVFAAQKDGWKQSGSYWYFYENGKKVTGWKQIDKKWYFFSDTGSMIANESVKSGGKVYLLGDSGAMVTKKGWAKIKDSSTPDRYAWFYLKSGGVCTTGWKKIDGKWYFFYDAGYYAEYYGIGRMTDVPTIQCDDGKVYAFNGNGSLVTKTGWVSLKWHGDTFWFYMKKGGVCTLGWKKIGGKWYYFDSHGPMLSNTTRVIDGKNYKFNKSGVCTNP